MYSCKKCGCCCSNVGNSEIYSDLDRGDGKCRYFDESTKLCTIYENRPLKCNVDKTYDFYFKDKITKEEYYKMNYEACRKLKNINKSGE